MQKEALASLPRVDTLLAAAPDLVARYGRPLTTDALRAVLAERRAGLLAGEGAAAGEDLVAAAAVALAGWVPGPPRRVVNAAGIVVHTNLGRAPLAAAAVQAAVEAAGYCDLEVDLAGGGRGSREAHLEPLLVATTGAQAGIAVNNAAAALVLVLAALAAGREVLVSRGELVEIGGSFRLPDIMAASGARLVEVGTTNRTRAADYAAALARPGADVALILVVHPSNYRITGFTEAPALAELVALGAPVVHDVGSGLLHDRDEPWFAGEPSVAGSLAAGAGVVVCSGDKLLGGPQAGLLVGSGDLVRRCRAHPLARALRLDKLRVAALSATLAAHVRGAPEELPVWGMLAADPAPRVRSLAHAVGGEVTEATTLIGGGCAPGAGVASPVVRLPVTGANAAAARLRTGDPPIVVRVEDDALLIDLRTVPPEDDTLLRDRLLAALT